MSEDWESRMAARAAARRHAAEQAEAASRAAAEREWHERNDTTVEEYVSRLAADPALDPDELGIPCACTGAPPELWHLGDGRGSAPCSCALWEMAKAQRRAAQRPS